MTTLTWRDVAAPNFQGVQDGFQNFGNLFDHAITAAKQGVSTIDTAQKDNVNSAIEAALAAAQTPDAVKQLAASVGTTYDPTKVSAATWQALAARPGELTKQASAEGDLKFTQDQRAYSQAERDAMDAATPDVAKYLSAYMSGDGATAQKVYDSSPSLQKLHPNQLTELLNKAQDATKSDLGIQETRTNQFNSAQDRSEERQTTALADLIRQQGVSPADFEAYINSNYDGLVKSGISPVVLARARHAVLTDPTAAASFFQDGTLPGGGGGGAGGDTSRVMNYEAAGKGVSAIPDSVQTLGQWSDFTKQVNAKGIASSAGGLYQITGDTLRQFAPAALGSGWQSAPLNAVNQDKVGSAIFADAAGKADPVAALRGRWSSLSKLSNDDVAALAKMPWEQARNIIASKESGTNNVSAIISRGAQDYVAQVGPQYNKSTDPNQVYAQQMVAAFNDTSDARTVAGRLVSAGGKDGAAGPLAGEDVADVAGNIKYITDHYHVNPAAAGIMLTKAAGFNKNGLQSFADSVKGIFGGGDALKSKIDWGQIDQLGKMAGNRAALTKMATVASVNDASSSAAAATAQAAALANAAAQAQQQAAARLGRKVNPAAVLNQVATANNLRDQGIANSAGVTDAGSRPTPPPAPAIDRHAVPQHPQADATPAPKANPANVTAVINQHLTAARNIRSKVNDLASKGADTPFNVMGLHGNIRNEENAALQLAMTLPRFSRQNGESYSTWRGRVARAIHVQVGQ